MEIINRTVTKVVLKLSIHTSVARGQGNRTVTKVVLKLLDILDAIGKGIIEQ